MRKIDTVLVFAGVILLIAMLSGIVLIMLAVPNDNRLGLPKTGNVQYGMIGTGLFFGSAVLLMIIDGILSAIEDVKEGR